MSRETCWMRCEMPQPCMGSSARVFRISRSSVPCRISTAGLMHPPLDGLQVKYPTAPVDCQGGGAIGWRLCGFSAAGSCGVTALPSLCDMTRSDNAPLWGPDHQYDRLEELAAGSGDDTKEIPLRRDVRSLGMLLGKVLVEQAGEPLLEVVEQLRRLLIQQREQLPAAATEPSRAENTLIAQAREKIARLEVEDAYRVTK